jgi:hypothetical protein
MTNLGGRRSEVLLNRVAADIGQAVDAVEAFWGTDWPRDIAVVATGSQRQFETEAGGGPAAQWADIAAVAVADRVDPARRIAIGQRIVFAPGAVGMSASALRIVLNHELFHYAARADTAVDAPRWLTEGVADYVARPATADGVAVGRRPGRAGAAAFVGLRPGMVVRAFCRRHPRVGDAARVLPGRMWCRARRSAHRRA